mgnify:CR=1 FL=1
MIDLDDIDIPVLEEFLSTPSGHIFFDPSFNLIEELSISSLNNTTREMATTLSQFINLLSSFPFLKYVSLASSNRIHFSQIGLPIESLVIPDYTLNNLMILYIISIIIHM